MKKKDFQDLLKSTKEVKRIIAGKKKPSRVFRMVKEDLKAIKRTKNES